MDASVNRLHEGKSNKHDVNHHYDCVPNLFFIRENPRCREHLHGGGMNETMNNKYHGRIHAEANFRVEDQPYKNYTRHGFLPKKYNQYKPESYPDGTLKESDTYLAGNQREPVDRIHQIHVKPIYIDDNVGS